MTTLVPQGRVAAVETARALMVLAEQSPMFVGRFEELNELLEVLLPNTSRHQRAYTLSDIAKQVVGQRTLEHTSVADVQESLGMSDPVMALSLTLEIRSSAEAYAFEAEARALTAALVDRTGCVPW